jgi:hypothetical protein
VKQRLSSPLQSSTLNTFFWKQLFEKLRELAPTEVPLSSTPLSSSTDPSSSLSPSSSSSLPSPTPTEQQLNSARVYLSLHRMLQYKLPPDVQKAVEEDFVAMRRTDANMTADKFHRLLCLARLVSLSYGCSELTLSHWNHAKHLENQRMARLQTVATS